MVGNLLAGTPESPGRGGVAQRRAREGLPRHGVGGRRPRPGGEDDGPDGTEFTPVVPEGVEAVVPLRDAGGRRSLARPGGRPAVGHELLQRPYDPGVAPQRPVRADHARGPARELSPRRELLRASGPVTTTAGAPRARHHDRAHPRHRRRGEGEQRPPRRADGPGPGGVDALHPPPAPLAPGPGLAGPRPLRALGRPRLGAPLRAAPPDRLRPADGASSSASASSAPKTPGHPERGDTPGVEITTGPLGQGIGNAVGLRAGRGDAGRRASTAPGHEVVDHRTWFICSDGDLMEGISHEAASHRRLPAASSG